MTVKETIAAIQVLPDDIDIREHPKIQTLIINIENKMQSEELFSYTDRLVAYSMGNTNATMTKAFIKNMRTLLLTAYFDWDMV